MFTYHVDETHDGKSVCVNLYSTVAFPKTWSEGKCESKTLLFNAEGFVAWDGHVWTA